MSIVRSGPTQKYAEGWDMVFGGKRRGKGASAAVAPARLMKKTAKKKTAKKKKKSRG